MTMSKVHWIDSVNGCTRMELADLYHHLLLLHLGGYNEHMLNTPKNNTMKGLWDSFLFKSSFLSFISPLILSLLPVLSLFLPFLLSFHLSYRMTVCFFPKKANACHFVSFLMLFSDLSLLFQLIFWQKYFCCQISQVRYMEFILHKYLGE